MEHFTLERTFYTSVECPPGDILHGGGGGILHSDTVNKLLTRLELYENPIGDIGAASIGDAIKTNAVLERLRIDHCEITSEGAVQLSAGLAINKSLTKLKLRLNPIGDIGAASIGDVIKTNAVLEHLVISVCEITSEGTVQLTAGLAVNKSLTKLKLCWNPIRDYWSSFGIHWWCD